MKDTLRKRSSFSRRDHARYDAASTRKDAQPEYAFVLVGEVEIEDENRPILIGQAVAADTYQNA